MIHVTSTTITIAQNSKQRVATRHAVCTTSTQANSQSVDRNGWYDRSPSTSVQSSSSYQVQTARASISTIPVETSHPLSADLGSPEAEKESTQPCLSTPWAATAITRAGGSYDGEFVLDDATRDAVCFFRGLSAVAPFWKPVEIAVAGPPEEGNV
jgi:hypothetical protein